jgi:quercetin dioxygenase-like cupin family protein
MGGTHYRWDDIPKDELSPELSRRFVHGEQAMLAQVFLKKGCVVPVHTHDNEQLAYIVEGGLRFWLGERDEEVCDVLAGEVLVIPGGVPHRAEALEDTLDIDIFAPPRQDWIDGTDRYFPRSA